MIILKKMRKVLALLLAVAMLAAVMAGCDRGQDNGGNWGDEPVQTDPPATKPVTYDSYYYFYDYGSGEYMTSNVATYQAVTGGSCELSALDWTFLEGDYSYVVEGYDDRYGVFLYEYNEALLESYREYLTTVGYTCMSTERYTEGFSYYFGNEDGFLMDIFVAEGDAYLVIEPYIEADEGDVPATEATEAPTEAPVIEEPVSGTFYYFYDYGTNEYYSSDIMTYQDVTGAVCTQSALDWGFLEEGYTDIVDGYDDRYAVFIYEYDAIQLAAYESYLESRGYEYTGTEQFQQGRSYYYENPSDGSMFDLFVGNNDAFVVIEPYLNTSEG